MLLLVETTQNSCVYKTRECQSSHQVLHFVGASGLAYMSAIDKYKNILLPIAMLQSHGPQSAAFYVIHTVMQSYIIKRCREGVHIHAIIPCPAAYVLHLVSALSALPSLHPSTKNTLVP